MLELHEKDEKESFCKMFTKQEKKKKNVRNIIRILF